jgi:predicted GNAT family acetyltransferase
MEFQNPIFNNTQLGRFETEIDGELAYIEYRFYKGAIALMHTFAPEFVRGKGVSSMLAKFALEYIKEQNLSLMVYCPFVAKYIKRHPQYGSLIDKQYGSGT